MCRVCAGLWGYIDNRQENTNEGKPRGPQRGIQSSGSRDCGGDHRDSGRHRHPTDEPSREGANDSALAGSLQTLRSAIDLYTTEHSGSYPDGTNINAQLTQYSNASGNVAAAKDTGHIYGPYLRTIPPAPVGARKGGTTIATADAAGVGWIYDPVQGKITANTTTEADDAGKLYNGY